MKLAVHHHARGSQSSPTGRRDEVGSEVEEVMKKTGIAITGKAAQGSVAKAVESAATAVGLQIVFRTTTRSYPGSIHWHFKKLGEPRGTLEITYWPKRKRLWAKVHHGRRAKWIAGSLTELAEEINGRLAEMKGVGGRLLDKDSGDDQYRVRMAVCSIRSTLTKAVGDFPNAAPVLRSLVTGLILLGLLVSGCGKAQTTIPPSKTGRKTGQTENAELAPAMDSQSKIVETSSAVGDNSNLVERQISADSQPWTEAVASAPAANDFQVQNLDPRLQDMLSNIHTTGDRVQRSAMAGEMVKLTDVGVPKAQIASALGYLFRDENSVDVKTDILNELGDLDDPSAFGQVIAGLDQHQPDEIHTAAIEALDSLGDKRAIPLIQPFLTDRDEDVRNAAQSAIDSLNDQ